MSSVAEGPAPAGRCWHRAPVRCFTASICRWPTQRPRSSRPMPSSVSASDGKITLVMPQVEMGQGVYTSIAMIMAEELDADFTQVVLEHAPPDEKHYANPMLGVQATGNSNSIRAFWKPLRTAGATTRAMLVMAAAQQWGVDAASCTTSNSQVIHAASGRKLGYGALAARAASLTPARQCGAQGSGQVHADRQAAQAAGYARQGQRPGAIWHRCDAAGREIRHPCRFAGIRRQGRPCRRQQGQGDPRRAPGGGAGRSGRGGGRSHVGGQEGARGARHHLERGRQRPCRFHLDLGRHPQGQRPEGRRGQGRRRRRQGTGRWRQAGCGL